MKIVYGICIIYKMCIILYCLNFVSNQNFKPTDDIIPCKTTEYNTSLMTEDDLYMRVNKYLTEKDVNFYLYTIRVKHFTPFSCAGYKDFFTKILIQSKCSLKYFLDDYTYFKNIDDANVISIKKMSNFTCGSKNYYLKFGFRVNDSLKALYIWPDEYYKFYDNRVYSNIPILL